MAIIWRSDRMNDGGLKNEGMEREGGRPPTANLDDRYTI